VFSTSHTAVALGIRGVVMDLVPPGATVGRAAPVRERPLGTIAAMSRIQRRLYSFGERPVKRIAFLAVSRT